MRLVDEHSQSRMADNESAFRDVNESIERGLWPGEEGQLVPFRCECATLSCDRLVDLTPVEYEHVRADPRRFFVCIGHELPEVERVVETHERYLVVEKVAAAGAAAQAKDPRD
jgi:hypothetical protein